VGEAVGRCLRGEMWRAAAEQLLKEGEHAERVGRVAGVGGERG
jgi:hypothetical protein